MILCDAEMLIDFMGGQLLSVEDRADLIMMLIHPYF
jgi:hypothetical protein